MARLAMEEIEFRLSRQGLARASVDAVLPPLRDIGFRRAARQVAPARRIAVFERLCRWLTTLSLGLLFLISPMVLFQAGLNYEGVGGNPLEKLHPGHFLIMLALLCRMIAQGPIRYLTANLMQNPGLALYLVTTLFLVWFTVFVQKAPFTPLVDTFIPVIAMFLILKDMPATILSRYATMLHIIFAANALLALYEYLSGNRLTPYVAGTFQVGEDDWRSTALFGHPLANAMFTGAYILCLAARGAGIPVYLKAVMLMLQLASLVAFGARAALVATLLMFALVMLGNLVSLATGRLKIPLGFVALAIMAVPLLALGLAVLDDAGFFDRLIDRFLEDKGSASTRVAMFELFKYLNTPEFLFGPDPALIDSLKGIEGIESGIESFWVAFALTYGLFPSLLFFTGLMAFCVTICLRLRPYAFYVFAFFFAVASTSVSLSAKGPLFGMFLAILFIVLKPARLRSVHA